METRRALNAADYDLSYWQGTIKGAGKVAAIGGVFVVGLLLPPPLNFAVMGVGLGLFCNGVAQSASVRSRQNLSAPAFLLSVPSDVLGFTSVAVGIHTRCCHGSGALDWIPPLATTVRARSRGPQRMDFTLDFARILAPHENGFASTRHC